MAWTAFVKWHLELICRNELSTERLFFSNNVTKTNVFEVEVKMPSLQRAFILLVDKKTLNERLKVFSRNVKSRKSTFFLEEICAISNGASKRDIGRCFKQILKSLPNSNPPESIEIKNLVVKSKFVDIDSLSNFLDFAFLAAILQSTRTQKRKYHSENGGIDC